MRRNAFSLAEVIIAATFIGIMAMLTIPSSVKSAIYKSHVSAYKQIFDKVKEVTANAALTDSTYPSAEKYWAMLNDALPVIGYTDVDIQSDGVHSEIIPMTAANLKERAKWGETVIGSATGEIAETKHGLYSPWIVTENGMAFTVNSWPQSKAGLGLNNSCGTVSNIFHASGSSGGYSDPTNHAAAISCIFLYVDVNGLDKGPNTHPSYQKIKEGEAYNEIREYDRFHIFVGLDGVSAGPEGVATYYITRKN